MPETLNLLPNDASKADKYAILLPQIKALLEHEDNLVANLANVSAALKQAFNFWWVGFYLVDGNKNELVLGPFQGPIACTRIRKGKGVCGTSWDKNETIVVPDVELFPGHIACSSESKSEIVVPLTNGTVIHGVLDVDSEHLNHFDEIDSQYLNEICKLLFEKF